MKMIVIALSLFGLSTAIHLERVDTEKHQPLMTPSCANICRMKKCPCGEPSVSMAYKEECETRRCNCSASSKTISCLKQCQLENCNCGSGSVPLICSSTCKSGRCNCESSLMSPSCAEQCQNECRSYCWFCIFLIRIRNLIASKNEEVYIIVVSNPTKSFLILIILII